MPAGGEGESSFAVFMREESEMAAWFMVIDTV